MRRKIVLDILILFFLVVFFASITNFATATTGQNETYNAGNNDTGSNIESNNTANQSNIVNSGIESYQFNLTTGIKGDVDGSGTVNSSDAAKILIYAANMGIRYVAPTEQMLEVADINGDDVINASDAALILIFAAKQGAAGPGEVITWDDVLNEI